MVMHTKRLVHRGVLLAALAVVPLAAGCAGSAEEGDGGSKAARCTKSKGKVELSFWSWVPGMEKVVAKWNRQNPDIQVKVKTTPAGNAGTYQNMSNALKTGKAPDLGQVEYDSLANFRLQNGLADISECPGVKAAKGDFVDWTWSQVTFGEQGGGGVWAVPQDTGPMALFYRKDLFKKHDIPVPATWAEYREAAEKLKKADPKAYITHFSQTDPNWFTGMLWQNGSSMFAEKSGKWQVNVDNPGNRKVAEYWQKMIDDKLVATDLQGSSPALYKAWNQGEVATWIGAAWGYSTIRDNAKDTAGKWAVAPMPQWSPGEHKTGNWGGSTTAVLSKSKHPYEAAKFALWLNKNTDSLKTLNEEGGLYPAAKKGLELPALKKPVKFYGNQKIFDTFARASNQVDTRWAWGPTMTDTYRFMGDGIAGSLGGDSTLSQMLKQADADTVDSLEKQALDVAK